MTMRILISPVCLSSPSPSPHPANKNKNTDLRQQHEVRLDEGLDTFVVVDGCPVVSEENKPRLIKFLCKKLGEAGRTKPDAVFMPVNGESGMTEG